MIVIIATATIGRKQPKVGQADETGYCHFGNRHFIACLFYFSERVFKIPILSNP